MESDRQFDLIRAVSCHRVCQWTDLIFYSSVCLQFICCFEDSLKLSLLNMFLSVLCKSSQYSIDIDLGLTLSVEVVLCIFCNVIYYICVIAIGICYIFNYINLFVERRNTHYIIHLVCFRLNNNMVRFGPITWWSRRWVWPQPNSHLYRTKWTLQSLIRHAAWCEFINC